MYILKINSLGACLRCGRQEVEKEDAPVILATVLGVILQTTGSGPMDKYMYYLHKNYWTRS